RLVHRDVLHPEAARVLEEREDLLVGERIAERGTVIVGEAVDRVELEPVDAGRGPLRHLLHLGTAVRQRVDGGIKENPLGRGLLHRDALRPRVGAALEEIEEVHRVHGDHVDVALDEEHRQEFLGRPPPANLVEGQHVPVPGRLQRRVPVLVEPGDEAVVALDRHGRAAVVDAEVVRVTDRVDDEIVLPHVLTFNPRRCRWRLGTGCGSQSPNASTPAFAISMSSDQWPPLTPTAPTIWSPSFSGNPPPKTTSRSMPVGAPSRSGASPSTKSYQASVDRPKPAAV